MNKEIANLLEQNHALATLRAKECIDSAFFMSETNAKMPSWKICEKNFRDIVI